MRYAQKQKSLAHPKEKKINEQKLPEEAYISDLLDRDFKSTSGNMFQVLKKSKDKERKETRTMKSLQIEISELKIQKWK